MSFARKPSNPLTSFVLLLFLFPAVTYSLMGPLQGVVKDGIASLRDAYFIGLPGQALLHYVAGRIGKEAGREHPKKQAGSSTWTQPGTEKPLSAVAFPGWSAAMRRHSDLERQAAGLCDEPNDGLCRLLPWQRFLDSLQHMPPMEQITQVNRYINKLRYRSDEAVWGKTDYWATPDEFLAKGGDCEDFAVAKYYSLKRLGFPPEAMRIVVLNDVRRDEAHAVLSVQVDGREILLDSLGNRIVTWRQVRHYDPIYSVNEKRSWLHAGLARAASKAAGD